ncbi:unnamed protein product, partial [Polarella glacialis]
DADAERATKRLRTGPSLPNPFQGAVGADIKEDDGAQDGKAEALVAGEAMASLLGEYSDDEDAESDKAVQAAESDESSVEEPEPVSAALPEPEAWPADAADSDEDSDFLPAPEADPLWAKRQEILRKLMAA